jgi:hypothetical protein
MFKLENPNSFSVRAKARGTRIEEGYGMFSKIQDLMGYN